INFCLFDFDLQHLFAELEPFPTYFMLTDQTGSQVRAMTRFPRIHMVLGLAFYFAVGHGFS
ncbi:MAG TPA: hypothetical protein VFA15_04800, partial [Nitrososphaera sp.]|nr:hypothetical protein [Nitrososphaera sp.]